ncbi:hypothetical protein [Dendronalium sp. ChiSLP03b]|nr:hypothetical protein [Dendronalium sp. ChiSLP03b]
MLPCGFRFRGTSRGTLDARGLANAALTAVAHGENPQDRVADAPTSLPLR